MRNITQALRLMGLGAGAFCLLQACSSHPSDEKTTAFRDPSSTNFSEVDCEKLYPSSSYPTIEFLNSVADHYADLWTKAYSFPQTWASKVHYDLQTNPERMSAMLRIEEMRKNFAEDGRLWGVSGKSQGVSHQEVIWFHENLDEVLRFAKSQWQTETLSNEQYQKLWRLTDKYYGPQTQNMHFATTEKCYGLNAVKSPYLVAPRVVSSVSSYSGYENTVEDVKNFFLARNWALELYTLINQSRQQ